MSEQRPNAELLSIQQVARYLGVDERSVRRYITDGDLPAYRIGSRLVRIKRDDIEALLTPITHLDDDTDGDA